MDPLATQRALFGMTVQRYAVMSAV